MSLVTVYTNPTNAAGIDATEIKSAKKTLDFAAYSLTEPSVCAAVLDRATAGVTVRLYLDRTELEAEARGNPALPTMALRTLMNQANIAIKVKASSVLMHLKSYCVDSIMLRDGSANFSPLGECEQDNSVTLITDATAITNFETKFARMWERADNLTIEQAIESSPSYAAHRGKSH